jgi:SAM-dependent methyltransferase
MTIWHEDDEFWRTSVGWMLRERLEGAREEVGRIVTLVDIATPAAVLDLGCGIGRHALQFARHGFKVTGVDRTRDFLAEARRTAEAEELEAEFVEEDMRRFRRPGEFDLVISMLTSFGYFEDPDEDRLVMQNICDSLKAGGALVLDTMGKEILARIFQPRDWREGDGEIWLFEREVTDSWSWMENRWIVIKDGERKEFRLAHRLYSAAELSQLMKDCGFSEAAAYGDLEGAPYDHQASRMVVVGRK